MTATPTPAAANLASPAPAVRIQAGPGAAAPASACLNCGTLLAGGWCHACGQRSDPHHRSLLHLAAELLETLTHADSRLWRTMRRLALDPARLTRDYLDGRRASEIPPLRLFFVMLFLLFGIGSLTAGGLDMERPGPAAAQAFDAKIAQFSLPGAPRTERWLRTHVEQAADDPAAVLSVMREWSERFTILMLPIAALLLWLLHLPGRRFSLYDHTITAMHSLCFGCLALIAVFIGRTVAGGAAGWLLLLLPVHLFAHLRGLHRTSIFGTLLRMALLGSVSLVAFLLLLLALAALGLELGARA